MSAGDLLNLRDPEALSTVQAQMERLSAAEAADLFLSPHVRPELLLKATEEAGPSMWIVNRSDVYDPTLEVLRDHAVPEIAARAKEKIRLRHHSLNLLAPPEIDGPVEAVPDYAVEDVLGHPLCPFEAMLFFSKAIFEDHRASSALSLTRRLLEHAPNWSEHLALKNELIERFSYLLLEDPSPFVRAYAARVPLLTSDALEQATRKEHHPLVRGRLLQNPASTPAQILRFWEQAEVPEADASSLEWSGWRIASLDGRLAPDARRAAQTKTRDDAFTSAVHAWYLGLN